MFLCRTIPRGEFMTRRMRCIDGLRSYILRTNPKVVIHGHQHVAKETRLEQTRVIGVYGHTLIEL